MLGMLLLSVSQAMESLQGDLFAFQRGLAIGLSVACNLVGVFLMLAVRPARP
jgi:hypothetical protein